MIVKGSARSGPAQLAAYLLRSDEHAEMIELLDGGRDLHKALMAWHTIGEASRGEKTLYHAQISPETKYPMTPEQWKRAAEILAEELGMKDHPRAIVVHEGHERPHAHVVFQRGDSETFKLWDDSFNYVKHERASLRMAKEFGHEIIPGKHAKRDRKKQPEFPRQKYNKDEAQYEQRTGLSKEERVEQITALRAAADNGQAFKTALEDAGYVLAQGDRGYIVVDQKGGQSVLSRNTGLKKKEIEAFMAGVELDKLPTIEEAKALQAERRKKVSKTEAPAEAQKQPEEKGVEASKFLEGQTPQKPDEPVQSPEQVISSADREPVPVDPERKQQIAALRAWADGAFAFKKALEEAGYILARGQSGYLLFSDEGTFSLMRHAGLSKAKLEAFMSPIPLDTLPEIKDLIEAQKQARAESKFLGPEAEWPQPPPLTTKAPDIDLDIRMTVTALDRAVEAIAEAQKPSSQQSDPELDALEKAIAKRHEEEAGKLREKHEYELRQREVELDREIVASLGNYKNIQDEQTKAFLASRKEYRTGIWGIIDAINSRWNPTLAAEKTQARELERQNFYRRLARERADYETLLQQTKQLEIENLIERQRLQLRDLETRTTDDRERYIQEHHEAKRILAELEQERLKQEELDRNDNLREGPPPPRMGK